MLYLTCTTIISVDLAHYGVSRAKDWVSVYCGTNKIIDKDVLWFFVKLVLQKITKSHDNVCCALTPRYNLLQEKQ